MENLIRLALFQPDMPPNTGAVMRLCACLGVALDIIEPCGFAFDDRKLKRAVMDYADHVDYTRHLTWDAFYRQLKPRRLVLLTTRAAMPYYDFVFRPDDVLLVGRESAGVPDEVHRAADAALVVPMRKPARSLNVGMAAAIVLAEAIRQQGISNGVSNI